MNDERNAKNLQYVAQYIILLSIFDLFCLDKIKQKRQFRNKEHN